MDSRGSKRGDREGTACRGMTARKGDTSMNERSDSCFSFYKRRAAVCPLSANTVGLRYGGKGEERSDKIDGRY